MSADEPTAVRQFIEAESDSLLATLRFYVLRSGLAAGTAVTLLTAELLNDVVVEALSQSAQLSRIDITLTPYILSQPPDIGWRPAETTRRAFRCPPRQRARLSRLPHHFRHHHLALAHRRRATPHLHLPLHLATPSPQTSIVVQKRRVRGASVDAPEEIVQSYNSLQLEDVYAVITYYLSHRAEVDVYIHQQERDADSLWQDIQQQPKYEAFRQQLLARRANL